MAQEIEAKFLNVDHDGLRLKLKESGAEQEFAMRNYRRVMFDHEDERFQKNDHSRRLRVRDEGDRVMLNFKSRSSTVYDNETEVEVSSFEDTVALLKSAGFVDFSYQESRREMWLLDGCEVCLDEWPWIPTYVEIEGPNEEVIKKVAAILGFDWSDAAFGSVDRAYQSEYSNMSNDDSIGDLAIV